MKKTFHITVQGNQDEETFDSHIKGPEWKDVCTEFAEWLRQKYKYENVNTIDTHEVREKLFEIIADHNLTLL